MTVATDLQDMVADVSAAIAGRKTFGRTELEVLRRRLNAVASEAGQAERAVHTARHALDEVCTGVEAGVLDLVGLARRGRDQARTLASGQ